MSRIFPFRGAQGMLKEAVISGLAVLLAAATLGLAAWRRPREVDDWGNPCMRFFGPRFATPIAGFFFLALGLYEANDAANYRDAGELLTYAYAPIAVAFALFAVNMSCATYRISLRIDAIEKAGWPFSASSYLLKDLESMQEKGRDVVLGFSDGRELKLNGFLSGREYFVARLAALTGRSLGRASLLPAGR
ncbi:MAG: hypothetical protein WCA17_12100 [Burkholderiales bacterium]